MWVFIERRWGFENESMGGHVYLSHKHFSDWTSLQDLIRSIEYVYKPNLAFISTQRLVVIHRAV